MLVLLVSQNDFLLHNEARKVKKEGVVNEVRI